MLILWTQVSSHRKYHHYSAKSIHIEEPYSTEKIIHDLKNITYTYKNPGTLYWLHYIAPGYHKLMRLPTKTINSTTN